MNKARLDWFENLSTAHCLAEFSLWSADLVNLQSDLDRIAACADILHIDVADGVFAPGFLFFPDLVASIRQASDLPIHAHLMVEDAVLLSQVSQFAEAGADIISVHAENDLAAEAIEQIADLGLRPGIVLRVESPVELAKQFLNQVSFVTLLGTAIGVKGQSLSKDAPNRIHSARTMVQSEARDQRIIVCADGGIRENTVPQLVAAGAETVVMGSLAFGAPNLSERMRWLKGLEVRFDEE